MRFVMRNFVVFNAIISVAIFLVSYCEPNFAVPLAIILLVTQAYIVSKNSKPYTKYPSENDWSDASSGEYSLRILKREHGKDSPSTLTYLQNNDAWDEVICSIQVNDGDVIVSMNSEPPPVGTFKVVVK